MTIEEGLSPQTRERIKQFADQVQAGVSRVVVGMEEVTEQFLIALIVGGHVLLEGVPGTAKTTLAKTLAHLLGIEYSRVQFTPDLLPSDITGTFVFDRKADDFVLRKGPLFCKLLLADEVNRAPAKTQAALLEAMQERQVTIEGTTLPLPRPFLVLATQNPVEQEGVYRLPEAQLDRFLLRIEMGYPSRETEVSVLRLHGGLREDGHLRQDADNGQPENPNGAGEEKGTPLAPRLPEAKFSAEEILELQSFLAHVFVEPTLLHYIVDLARASREHPDVGLGASPRASLFLLQCARARAMLDGRHYCTHQDVQEMALPVLGHRLILLPEAEVEGRSVAQIVGELLRQVPVLQQPASKRGAPA